MKILSVDSSAIIATVALADDERLLAEYSINNGNTHSETLLPMVETVLKTALLPKSASGKQPISVKQSTFTALHQ